MAAKKTAARQPVLAFVDYENIRQSAEKFYPGVADSRTVCKALKSIAGDLGEFRGGTFYGDWTLRAADARNIEAHGFKAELVLRTIGNKDRTDVQLAVEMMDAATRKETKILLLGAGDGDYKPLIRKAQERGKKVYVAAIGQSISRELLTLADGVIPLEKHLGLSAPEPQIAPDVATSAPLAGSAVDLVRRLDRLESRLPYVTRNYFRDQLPGEFEQRDTQLEQVTRDGLVLLGEVDNPKVPGQRVRAIRLNRTDPRVTAVLTG